MKNWVFFCLVLTGCSASSDVRLAEIEVAKFHDMFNSNAYEVIYVTASKHLKQQTSEKDFESLLSSISNGLGAVKRSDQTGWGVEANTSDGTLVTLKYHTVYENGFADEEFTYEIRSRRAALGNFKVHYTKLR